MTQTSLKNRTKLKPPSHILHWMSCLLILMGLWTTNTNATIYQCGAGVTTTSTSGITPFTSLYEDNRIQYVYLASELTSQGATAGDISSVAFNFTALGGPAPANVNIKIGHIAAATITSLTAGLSTYYSASVVTPVVGWNTYTLSTPFSWNGTSNIIIEVCRDNAAWTGNYTVQYTAQGAGNTRTFGYYADAVAGCSITTGSTASAANRLNRPNIRFDITSGACAGTPAPGNTVSLPSAVCSGVNFTLSLQNPTSGTGVTYQWQRADNMGFTVNAANFGTSSSTQSVSQTAPKYYRCIVTCGSNSGTSNPVQVTMSSFLNCYCASDHASGCGTDYINNVTLNTLSSLATGCSGGAYIYYNAGPTTSLLNGSSYTLSVSYGSDANQYGGAWIDFNQSGDFDASEYLGAFTPANAGANGTHSVTFTVPGGSTIGLTRLRVIGGNDVAVTTTNYCGASSNAYGETEDYNITIANPVPCTGTPTAGSISITGSGVCGGNTFAAIGYDATLNLVYQWESSTDNVNFFPIPSANGFTYTTPGFPSTTYYRFAVTCTNSGFTGYSNTITAAPALTPAAPVTTGDTRCGVGTVNLSATGAGTLRWFNSSSVGGPIINSGPTYSPSVTSNSTYYVFGSNSTVTQNVGLLANAAGTVAYASATSNYQTFDVLSQNGLLINTIDFIASPATPLNTPITVTLENSSGTILGSVSTVVTAPGTLQTMTLDFFVPYGSAYRLRPSQNPNLQYHQTGFTNPYTIPNQISITGFDGGNFLYVFFYNYSITTGCFSSVSPVIATVTTPPALTVTPVGSPSYCGTGSVTLNAAGTGYVNFSWSPATGLNSPSGSSVIASPTVTTTYTVTANDGSGPTGCANTATSTVTVLAKPSVIVSSSALSICKDATTMLTATGSSSSIKQFGTTESPANVTVSIYNGGNPTSRSQILMTAAELNAQGLFGPCNISSLGFQVSNKLSSSTYDGFTIGMAHSAVSSLTSTYETTTMSTVFSGNISTTLGWNTHVFTTPFSWNGTSNIIIETCFNNAGVIGFDQVYMSPTTVSQFINVAFLTCTTPTGTAVLNRPNIRLTGGAVNYAWTANPGLSNLAIPNPVFTGNTLGANNFTVTVTDPANGCTGFTNYSVYVQQPKPEALSNAPVCEGLQIALIGNDTIQPPTTGNSFSWSGPNGFASLIQNPTISGASQIHAGTYTLTITDLLGCTASTTTSISIYPNPALNILSQTNVECNGGSTGEFTIEVTNESGFFLFDENGNINFDGIFTGYPAGSYNVQVTDGNSCESTIPVTITEADPTTTADAGTNQSACSGSTVTLSANSALVGTGGWSLVTGSGVFTDASDPVTTVTGIGTGLNSYRWTITNTLCSNSNFDDVDVTGTDLPTATISGTQEICLGGSANLTITFTGTSPWLYSINGGTPVSTSTNPETVSVTPSSTTIYTITSLSDASCTGSGIGSATVTVSTAPPASSCTITSLPLDACVGGTVVVSTNVVPGATKYTWSAPAGTLIDGFASPYTSTSNSVNITLGALPTNSSSWLICAFASNACGSTNTNCKPIRGSLSMPSAIVGSTVACPSTGPSNYSTTAVGGASSYLWSITGDASVTGTGTTGAVTFGPTFTTGSLCVRALLPCGYQGPTRCMTIANGTPILGAMIGTFSVCPGTNGVAYSVPPSAGATTYNWTVPAGATVATGAGTNSITVDFGPTYTNGNVCVIAASICGINSLPRCKTVASITPGTPGNFTAGATSGVCGQTITYMINTVSGATGYTWTAPLGASIASTNGTNSIDIAFSGSYTTGNVCVTANNACGSGTPRCVVVKGNPANAGPITGLNSVCANDAGISYSIAPVFGSTGYVWTIPSGANIVSGQGTTSIIVDWGTNGGTIGVTASGTCGAFRNTYFGCCDDL